LHARRKIEYGKYKKDSGFKILNKLPYKKRTLITAMGARVISTAEKYKKGY
jgi:hypothetical protein